MADIAYAIALCILGGLSWDVLRTYLALMKQKYAVNDQVRALNARMDVIHKDVVDLGEMTKLEFQRMTGKQSMQAMSAAQFQPQTGGKPF